MSSSLASLRDDYVGADIERSLRLVKVGDLHDQ
jgi:hypothetical protein